MCVCVLLDECECVYAADGVCKQYVSGYNKVRKFCENERVWKTTAVVSVGLQLCPGFEVLSQDPWFHITLSANPPLWLAKREREVASGWGKGQSPLIWWLEAAPLCVCVCEALNNEPLYYRNTRLNLSWILATAGNTCCVFSIFVGPGLSFDLRSEGCFLANWGHSWLKKWFFKLLFWG